MLAAMTQHRSFPAVASDPSALGFDAVRLSRIDSHFAKYVDDGRLAGWHAVVSRRGQVVHSSTYGQRDIDAGLPFEDDTVVRMFSMSKPITSVAAMMLHEEGVFSLKEPISTFIPEFADTPVYRSGSFVSPVLEPQTEPIRIWHLLTHTSGLTYGFHNTHPVDALYRVPASPGATRRGWTSPTAAARGPGSRSCSSPAASGTTACRPTCSAASSRWRPASPSTCS